jgi:pimeloyl-ACP methyl ester carboxylesterase
MASPASFLDLRPEDPRWGHGFAPGADGVRLHYVRQGAGPPVLLLHGWPGFWYDWRRVVPALAAGADVIAPDLRGFGASDRPDLPPAEGYGAPAHARDLVALLDHLGIARVVVAGHDVGSVVAQMLARTVPERVGALALFNPVYPGIGMRRFEPEVHGEFWYQYFHHQPWADALVGYHRDTVRVYLRHFYDHWVGRKESVRPAEFEAIVDQYAQPGAFRASIAWYRGRVPTRLRDAQRDPRDLQIHQPTVVRWGELDPVVRVEWSDRLAEVFTHLVSFERLPGVGHFVPFEAPDETLAAIREALRAGAPAP